MVKVLIIEDELMIARFVMHELNYEGYEVDICGDGREGLEAALTKKHNLIVLDLMLPSLNGIEVLRRLRAAGISTPVIILTARDQVMDKVTGLDVGADDYMTKPFAIEELLARIRVLLKRSTAEGAEAKVLEAAGLKVDFNEHKVTFNEEKIELTKKEYDLLVYLMSNNGVVVTREKILDTVWGFDFYGDTNVVDVYIRYLRSKIDDKHSVKLIHTVRGTGYIFKG